MWSRRLAILAAALTLVLIAAGGLVTNTDSGLACPDWPTCFGSPMPKMVGGVAVEHTHRLIASAVGVLTVLLVVAHLGRLGALVGFVFAPLVLFGAFWAARVIPRTGSMPALPAALTLLGFAGCFWALFRSSGAARLSVLALILVLAQGLLGGATVVYRLPPTILVLHLATSMIFLSALVVLASGRPALEGGALAWGAVAAVYLQIVIGATVRHTGAGLVCTDLPWCRGALWPLGVHPAVHLHMVHRAFAFVVAGLVVWNALRLRRPLAWAAAALVGVQIALGFATILTFKGLFTTTAHLVVAAGILACQVAMLASRAPAQRSSLVAVPA